jgi:hypothetical protein
MGTGFNFKIIQTKMTKHYQIGFVFRICVFIATFAAYLFYKDELYGFVISPIRFGITPLHVLWLVFMLTMLSHLFPTDKLPMSLRKYLKETYVEVPDYSELELLKFVQDQNKKAWIVMLVWLCFNAIWGVLYLFGILDNADLLMLTVFYYLCDYICILLYCPFQSVIMKNKCCVNCRIYDWGHFMMFTPMLFIKDFFSWSLFFTSLIVLIHWEYIYAKHPERFWVGSNQILKCKNCKDKTCQAKKKIAKKAGMKPYVGE